MFSPWKMNLKSFIFVYFAVLNTALDVKNIAAAANGEDDLIVEKMELVNLNDKKKNGASPMVSVDKFIAEFNLVNGSRLLSLLKAELNASKRLEAGDCVVVLFYAPYCPFSSMAAPHFNALARAFPDIRMVALNAMKFHSFNTQYGVVGVPSLMLFHNGRPVAKFNDSEYNLEMFSKFLSKYTGLEPQEKLFITSADFAGPLPSAPLKETDYCLVLAWVFILVCGVYFFTKSLWWRWIVETIQNTWREAEAQHEHEQ